MEPLPSRRIVDPPIPSGRLLPYVPLRAVANVLERREYRATCLVSKACDFAGSRVTSSSDPWGFRSALRHRTKVRSASGEISAEG